MTVRLVAVLPLGFLLLLSSCGGGGDDDAAEPESPTATTAAEADTPTEEPVSSADLGDSIGALYGEALADLNELLKERPAAAAVQADVAALKERYVQQLVELGRQKEALSAEDRATVDNRVRVAINSVPTDVFTPYSEALSYYQQAGGKELEDLIFSFNIITQYADFDLLKQQEPEEATRLGIE